MNQERAADDLDPTARRIPYSEPMAGRPDEASPSRFRRLFNTLGPGFITGASDDDPSGIGTYASVGASLGFAPLWTALASFPLMATIQYTCAKVGMVAGTGLGGVLRQHYPRWVLYSSVTILIVANTINAGADIGAIAAGIHLLIPVPVAATIIPVTIAILALQIFGSYRLIARVFKWLTLALFGYIGAAVFARPDVPAVLRGTFIPTLRFDQTYIMAMVALLGTTISPYLFFWQASEEVEEEISEGRTSQWSRRGATRTELRRAGWDVGIGMLFSNVVMYFIILTTAATLHQEGLTNVQTATEAAQALRPLAGRGTEALLALGLIGSGFLAVPILTGSGAYAAAEAWGWRYGLDEKPKQAKPFYAVIIVATLVGMMINFIGINVIQALYWTAILNGLLAPPLLVLITVVANNAAVMGEQRVSRPIHIACWVAAGVMTLAAMALIATWL
ncbi:MAG TPA: divalent metal cation transporter [Gemmatimonadales bacterium]|nr:divalent metal cation transporter [Gemmatimonadales bacterium]